MSPIVKATPPTGLLLASLPEPVDIAAAERARAAGLPVVLDIRLKIEHGRGLEGLHFAGMNTEIISARRKRR